MQIGAADYRDGKFRQPPGGGVHHGGGEGLLRDFTTRVASACGHIKQAVLASSGSYLLECEAFPIDLPPALGSQGGDGHLSASLTTSSVSPLGGGGWCVCISRPTAWIFQSKCVIHAYCIDR